MKARGDCLVSGQGDGDVFSLSCTFVHEGPLAVQNSARLTARRLHLLADSFAKPRGKKSRADQESQVDELFESRHFAYRLCGVVRERS